MDVLFSTTATTSTTTAIIMGRKLNDININSILSNNCPLANVSDNYDDTTDNDNENNIDCQDCIAHQNRTVYKRKCLCDLYSAEHNACQHLISNRDNNSCVHFQDIFKCSTNHNHQTNAVNNCYDNNSKSTWYLPISHNTIKTLHIPQDNATLTETSNGISLAKLQLSSSLASLTSKSLVSINANVSKKQFNVQQCTSEKRNEPITITTTTITKVPNGISVDKFFHSNLSHQFRAISTPSLTNNKFIPRCNNFSISHNTLIPNGPCQSESEFKSMSNAHNLAKQKSNAGLFEKFKRTLVNFNRSHSSFSKADLSHAPNKESISKNATNKDINSTNIINDQQQNDSILNMNITDQLLQRSSQDRHRNKCNRQDKCNSGDSGIQIEMENFNSRQYLQQQPISKTFQLKYEKKEKSDCSVRRSNSAKFSSLGYDIKGKEKIKKRNSCNKIGQPMGQSSLVMGKSISQPYGLDSYGLTNGCNLDTISINSQTDDGGSCKTIIYGKVLYDFKKTYPQELSLVKGNLIEILYKESGPWWFGCLNEEQQAKDNISKSDNDFTRKIGWFPKEFVRIINSSDPDNICLQQQHQSQRNAMIYAELLSKQLNLQCKEIEEDLSISAPTKSTIKKTVTAGNSDNNNQKIVDSIYKTTNVTPILKILEISNSTLRDTDMLKYNAIRELLEAEINYVKHLAALCEGYLPVMSKRTDIFPTHSLHLIFSNITTIYKFHKRFLEALHKGIQQKQLAKVFLKMHKGFLCYSIYCNSYPRALVELESYEKNKEAQTVFNNCQEATNLQELPLSAHLLVPIQRICRYSLHLAEIIKTDYPEAVTSSSSDIPDDDVINNSDNYKDNNKIFQMALETMKNITETINEGKRHNESIERYQQTFQNFKGPPLHLHSTRFLLQIDATRQKQNLWNSSCTLFLFDNQIICCKRDILKRTQFIYKGRIHLDRCRIVNVKDGKMFGHTIKNSLRIYCEMRDKWYDFSFRSANSKQRFLNTLALERQFNGKTLYVAEMTGYQYAFRDVDVSDQSDYEELSNGSNCVAELKKPITNCPVTKSLSNSSLHFDDDSSLSDSMSKFYVIYDDPSVTSSLIITRATAPAATTTTTTATAASIKNSNCNDANEARYCGRRRLGNWFKRSKSSNVTPNQSPTHKSTTIIAHSTGDLEIAGTLDLADTCNRIDNKNAESLELLENRTKTY